METPSSSPLSSDSVRGVYDYVGRLVVPTLLLLYGLGFVVANLHLARYGYFSLGLFERRYAFAGFWALAPWFLWLFLSRLTVRARKAQAEMKGIWARGSLRLATIIIYQASAVWLLQLAVGQLLAVHLSWLKWFGFSFGAGIVFEFVLSGVRPLLRPPLVISSPAKVPAKPIPSTPMALLTGFLGAVNWVWTPLLVTYVVFFTALLFPDIPARWGGGG